jgi:hypothetical protein
MKNLIIYFIFFFFQGYAFSMEADNYTWKNTEKLPDSSDQFNKLVNQYIQQSIDELNQNQERTPPLRKVVSYSNSNLESIPKTGARLERDCNNTTELTLSGEIETSIGPGDINLHRYGLNYKLPRLPQKLKTFDSPLCDRKKLLKYLKSNLDRNWPEAREDMLSDESVSKGKIVGNKGSVYHNSAKGVLMSLGGCCDPLVSINNHYVGIDKLDHFLGHGAVYFEEYRENFNIEETLKIGERRENGGWGLTGTGVKSYGDAAANYAGLHFWANLIDGKEPFISCEDGQFKVSRKFDIRNYITPAMDESINCSSFNTVEVANAVDKYARNSGMKKRCPTVPESCKNLKKYYTQLEAKYILHPRCRETENSHRLSLHEKSNQGILGTLKDFWDGI